MSNEERVKKLLETLNGFRLSGTREDSREKSQKIMQRITYLEFLEKLIKKELGSGRNSAVK